METNGDLFEGLDDSEKEILEREIREGRVPMPVAVGVSKDLKKVTIVLPPLDTGEEKRDLRDPSTVGAKLLNSEQHRALASQHLGRPCTLSELYDFVAKRWPEKLEDSWSGN